MIKQFASSVAFEHFVCMTGLIFFATWLLRTSLGRKSLAQTQPRRNNMPIYLPFVALFIWLGTVSVLRAAILLVGRQVLNFVRPCSGSDRNFPLEDWQSVLLDRLIFCIGAIITIAVIIFLARITFARGLKGLGLSAKTIHKDFFAAFVNLLSVGPLILAMIILTTYFGRVIWGQDFLMPQHEELELITTHQQLPLKVMIVITAVVIAPVLEEMLFRGLFQTMIRSLLVKPWLSIAISSIVFTTAHQNPAHWPALFVLALCLGYAYEKSGSLFRPIFIHTLFNGVTIAAALH